MHLSQKQFKIEQFQPNFWPPADMQGHLPLFGKYRYPAFFGGQLEFLRKTQKCIYLRNGAR